jgi:hypothetical protein
MTPELRSFMAWLDRWANGAAKHTEQCGICDVSIRAWHDRRQHFAMCPVGDRFRLRGVKAIRVLQYYGLTREQIRVTR